jgi:GT2 family glycosyltransferase
LNRTAIILLNWNSFEHTSNCIHSLKKCKGEAFDIIVVDNGSVDGSLQTLQHEFEDVIFLPNEKNLGFAEGNNRGFEYAIEKNYEYVMMLNNDVFVKPNFLVHLTNYMDVHPETGAIQPKIYFNNDRSKVWNGGSKYANFFGWTYSNNYMRKEGRIQQEINEVDWITGCALMVRTSILKEIGLLNKNFFIYYEDVDLSFRIKKAGYKLIFHPDSVIYHIAGMSHKFKKKGPEGYSNPIVHYLNFRNHLWLLRKWTKWYQWPTTLFTYFSYSLAVMAYFVLRFRWKKLAAVGRGISDGFLKSYTS